MATSQQVPLTRAQRVRQVGNLMNLSSALGLTAARLGRARLRPGPQGLLLAEGYREPAILIECVTYGAAGMATTREFISMTVLHLLADADLRARYLAGEEEERFDILHEILRLEPIIGHLYRRAARAPGHDVLGPVGQQKLLRGQGRYGHAQQPLVLGPRQADAVVKMALPALHTDGVQALHIGIGHGLAAHVALRHKGKVGLQLLFLL